MAGGRTADRRRSPAGWSPGRVSRREWLGLAAGAAAVVSLLLPWTELTASDAEVRAALAGLPAADVSRSAWDSTFFAWLPPVLLALAGVVVVAFGQFRTARASGLPHLWVVTTGVALCSTVLAWVFRDWQFGPQQRAFLDDAGVDLVAGPGRWVAAAALAVSLTAAVLDLRAGVGPAGNRSGRARGGRARRNRTRHDRSPRRGR